VPVLVALILFVVRRRRTHEDPIEDPEYVPLLDGRPRPLTGPAAAEPAPVARLEFTETPEAPPRQPELDPLQVDLEHHRRDLESFARRDPRRTAELLRALLYDGQDA
jgi:flagellar M-ring protein FliF